MEENEKQHTLPEQEQQVQPEQTATPVKPDILDYDDICKMAPFF